MKVKLAVKSLSTYLADAIKFIQDNLCLSQYQNDKGTKRSIRLVNNVFDILNWPEFKRRLNFNNIKKVKDFVKANSYTSKFSNGAVMIVWRRKTSFIICLAFI